MASPYAAQLNRIASLQGANEVSAYNRDQSAYNLAKLEYQNELNRQRKQMRDQKKEYEDDWWKRGLGAAASGALTGALSGMALGPGGMLTGALVGAGTGALGGFGGSLINEKLMGGALGNDFGMRLGQAAGAAGVGAYDRSRAQLGLGRSSLPGKETPILDPNSPNVIGPGEVYYNTGDGGVRMQRLAEMAQPAPGENDFFGMRDAPNMGPPATLANPSAGTYTPPWMRGNVMGGVSPATMAAFRYAMADAGSGLQGQNPVFQRSPLGVGFGADQFGYGPVSGPGSQHIPFAW